MRKSNIISRSNLRYHNNTHNFFNLLVIRRRDSIHIASNLCFKITNWDKFLKNIFRKYISVAILFNFIRIDKDMIGSQMKTGSWDSSDSPIWMTSELLLFIRFTNLDHHFFSQNICCFYCHRCLLHCFLSLLLNILDGFLLQVC